MKKPKVSTFAIDYQKKKQRIVKLFLDYPEGMTPKQIACITRINQNTVKSLLPKIKEIKKKEGFRGIYVLVENNPHGSIFDWNLHNVTLIYPLEEYGGERINQTVSSELVNLRFGIGAKSKSAYLHLASEYPINISSLDLLCLYFLKCIQGHVKIESNIDKIIVRSIEFNKDYLNLRLDGLNSISFTSLLYQYKLYQKKQGLRQEHKINMPIGAVEIFSMLKNGEHILEVYSELNSLKKSQEELKLMVKNILNINTLYIKKTKTRC